jgi:hypothetical protein
MFYEMHLGMCSGNPYTELEAAVGACLMLRFSESHPRKSNVAWQRPVAIFFWMLALIMTASLICSAWIAVDDASPYLANGQSSTALRPPL